MCQQNRVNITNNRVHATNNRSYVYPISAMCQTAANPVSCRHLAKYTADESSKESKPDKSLFLIVRQQQETK